jgi:dihydrofolate reductase
MTTTYTFDVFASLDGFAAHTGDWGGYWGKQGPEFLEHRREQYRADQRMVVGGNTHRGNVEMLAAADAAELDAWVALMRELPATVVSNSLARPLDWPDATVAGGDAVEVVRRLKAESPVPLRSHGSLSLNNALLNAGLVDVVQVTIFPIICGATGINPVFAGAADFDLALLDSRTFDGRIQQLTYRPTAHAARERS